MKKLLKNIVSIVAVSAMTVGIVPEFASAESEYMKGVGTHFTHAYDSEKDLPLLIDSGVKTIRDTIYWGHVEQEEGIYNWSDYDWWLGELEKIGIDAYICAVSQTPPYYTDTSKAYFSTEKEIDAFCKFLKAMLERYPAIHHVELWNEPNLSFGNNASEAERMQCYINMVKAASKAIRSVRDDVDIIGCCVANNDSLSAPRINSSLFMNTVLPEIYPYVNSVSMHTYVTPKTAESRDMQTRIAKIDAVMETVGDWKKLYASELGWVTNNTLGVGVSEKAQAENTVKILSIMDKYDYAGSYIYDLKNDGTDASESEHNFGLVYYDRTPKQSYNSFKEYLANTSGYTHVGAFEESGYEKHLYIGENDAFILKWDLPESVYISETPIYESKITLGNAKTAFKKVLSADYSALKTKASGMGVNISEDISKLLSMSESGKEEELFYANYELGNTLIDKQLTGAVKLKETDLSSLLYDIHMIGNEMTAVYDISPDISDEDISKINNKFEVMRETTDTYENESLFLSRAMTDMAKEKLDEINSSTTIKVNGEESGVVYSLDGKSVLGISGEAPVGSYVSFMIRNDSGYMYADTVYADSEGVFDINVPLNGNEGAYNVTVGKSSGETVNFTVEKKKADMSVNYIQTQYILDYASGMTLVTGAAPLTVYEWQYESDGQINTEFELKCGQLSENVRLFSAKYENNVLVECDYEFLTLTPAQSAEVTLSNTYSDDVSTTYKTFVWDEVLKPYK